MIINLTVHGKHLFLIWCKQRLATTFWVYNAQTLMCQDSRTTTIDAAPVGSAMADLLAHTKRLLSQFRSLLLNIEDRYDSTHNIFSFLLRLFITLILTRNTLSISFCYVSGAKLLLFDNIQKIFVTFCLEKRGTITFLHITTYLIFHFKSLNHANHYRITQREKNKIKALIPQKSLRSERAGRRDKHHTAIHINTMKV